MILFSLFTYLIYIYKTVFSAKQEDFENIMRKQNIVKHDTVVKLRGLPWGVNEEEIEKFFDGMFFLLFNFINNILI